MIGIMGAMECEISLLLSHMTDVSSMRAGAHTFHVGELAGCRCVLARCGVGKVNAAAAAALMIEKYHPAAIINIGVGGGLAPDLSIGELVAADALCEHDLVYGILGDKRGTVFYPDGRELIMLPTDGRVTGIIAGAAAALGVACRRGIVASGDRFVDSAELKKDIREAFGADVCEMEGAAVAQVACAFDIPFAVLRSVSDLADGSAPESFEKFASWSADVAANVISAALPELSALFADRSSAAGA